MTSKEQLIKLVTEEGFNGTDFLVHGLIQFITEEEVQAFLEDNGLDEYFGDEDDEADYDPHLTKNYAKDNSYSASWE